MKTLILSAVLLSGIACGATGDAADPLPPSEWITLFDGATMGKWKSVDFGGEGDVAVCDGNLAVECGNPLTGVVWTGEPPLRMSYEIELEAMRTDGNDFFCGLTFPYNQRSCTFIVGGWGGGLVGLSSLGGLDASENDTSEFAEFVSNRWYEIRVRVTPDAIKAWIDDKEMVNAKVNEEEVGVRFEMEYCCPLGLATYDTSAAYRNLRMRPLPDAPPTR